MCNNDYYDFTTASHERDIAIIEGDPIKHIMPPEEFKQAMADAYHQHYEIDDDVEVVHCIMDGIMCDLLRDLGYGEGIDIFDNTPKWYA